MVASPEPLCNGLSVPRDSASKGLRYIALAAFWFSIMSMLVKLAGRSIPFQQIVLVRAAVSLVLSYALIRRAGISPWGKRHGLLFLRGLLGFLALTCFFFSVVHIPLAEATVIHYTNPVFTAVLAALFLGERVSARTASCVAASLAGVVMIARPGFLFGGGEDKIDPLYVSVALAAAILSAGAYVVVRRLGSSENPHVVVFWFPLVAVPLATPWAAAVWVWPTPVEWLLLIGVGTATQIAQVYLTKGLALEQAGRAMTVGCVQIVFAAAWGALIFGDFPDAWSVAGAVVVVTSTLVLARVRYDERPDPTLTSRR
jgi:drug/metabolite transporter (DMT)-like permease